MKRHQKTRQSMTYGVLPPRTKFTRHAAPLMKGGYTMELVGRDIEAASEAIDQGIDSHLEAVRFSQFTAGHKLGLRIADAESLHTFLRRLIERGDDYSMELAGAIMSTLDYEWI